MCVIHFDVVLTCNKNSKNGLNSGNNFYRILQMNFRIITSVIIIDDLHRNFSYEIP